MTILYRATEKLSGIAGRDSCSICLIYLLSSQIISALLLLLNNMHLAYNFSVNLLVESR